MSDFNEQRTLRTRRDQRKRFPRDIPASRVHQSRPCISGEMSPGHADGVGFHHARAFRVDEGDIHGEQFRRRTDAEE